MHTLKIYGKHVHRDESGQFDCPLGSNCDLPNKMTSLKPRHTSIKNTVHPEWGTFGVYEDQGEWYVIHGERGSRILDKDEAIIEWVLV